MSIEIGKKYIVINSYNGNNGAIVTVTGYGGKSLDGCTTATGDRWYVDREFITNTGNVISHMGEKQLKPIDDDESRKVTNWEELKDIWLPPLVTAK